LLLIYLKPAVLQQDHTHAFVNTLFVYSFVEDLLNLVLCIYNELLLVKISPEEIQPNMASKR